MCYFTFYCTVGTVVSFEKKKSQISRIRDFQNISKEQIFTNFMWISSGMKEKENEPLFFKGCQNFWFQICDSHPWKWTKVCEIVKSQIS